MFHWVLNTPLKLGVKKSDLEQRTTYNKINFKIMHTNEITILKD